MDKNTIFIVAILSGYILGFIIGKTYLWYYNSKYYGMDDKKWIEDSMSEKYGDDWLDQCMDGLRDKEVRDSVAKQLKLR